MLTFAFVSLFLVAILLRLLPARMAPHGSGVDQWFWRAYIEAVRREKRFPPNLPQFLLDEAQWYPPLFPWLLSRLPVSVFERYAGLVAISLDLLRMLMLIWTTRALSGSDLSALVAGFAYALTPVLITYNMQLNPRGLGALFLDATWLSVAAAVLGDGNPLFWGLALVFAGLVLITHKMTTQLFVFTAVVGTGLSLDFKLALLVPGAMLSAFILSGGFYRFVLRAHGDILAFWYRNWRWSGSNPVLESPIYGEPGFESPSKYYRRGGAAWLRRLQFVVGFNPWMPAVLAIGLLAGWNGHAFTSLETWAFAWLAISFVFALLTTLVPALRCLGQGYLYGYNGSFPAALALGLSAPPLAGSWYWPTLVGVTVFASFAALAAFFRALRTSRTMKVDADLDAAISRLDTLPEGAVMCLPQHWHDVVAYRTGKAVAFGGHGYGFSQLAPVFPRFVVPVRDFIVEQRVAYLLLWLVYVNDKFINDLPAAEIEIFGDYRLYKFADTVEEGMV